MANEALAELSLLGAQGLHAAQCVEAVQVIDLEQLADAAKKRLAEWIARSTGQHQRAVRKAFIALIKQVKERNHVTHG
jgi:hypothetical protein